MKNLIGSEIVSAVLGNPIPVYPEQGHPEISLNIPWVATVFSLNFFINVLIIYSGIYLLFIFKALKEYNFPTGIILKAALLISLVGLISELLLGSGLGLLLVLTFVFLSFLLLSKYLLKLSWKNGYRIALFALSINIIVWIFVFLT
jgi:hypothetical protein